ncbi:kynureninase [Patella vulgata]|uniref:kynureninase n=1 Tax=Patella vulgata TaxID=6465 RepID=UPI0021801455|nr:kynureninase [Patella vulgata]
MQERSDMKPSEELEAIAKQQGCCLEDLKFAQYMDTIDPIRPLRQDFHYPKMKDIKHTDLSIVNGEEDCVYFCGNSLGLCPKKTKEYMDIEIDKWSKLGVQGHTNGDLPWAYCDERIDKDMAKIVGGKEGEVALMNGLTVNLHLLLISFYQPTKDRHKILCEGKAFPSDHYAFESQIKLHGYDPATSLRLLEPREGEFTLRTEDIIKTIEEEGESIAVICLSGVQYYTGQYFDIPTITQAGQKQGCYVGWDLAHAAGNLPLYLHDWGVDFACWCSYKYLCGSAGTVAGFFLHEKYRNNNFPKLLGWWGHNMDTRFQMDNVMDLSPGAYGYRISNPPGFLCVPIKASLEIYNKTSMIELRTKSKLLTGYLEMLIKKHYGRQETNNASATGVYIDIFTPSDPEQRGAQLSLSFSICIQTIFKELEKRGVVCDKRYPRVIRISPVPIFCSFQDVHRFMKYLYDSIQAAKDSNLK